MSLCYCGHHRDMHQDEVLACLGSRCACPVYRTVERKDSLVKRPVRPEGHTYLCKCMRCVRWEEWMRGNGQ